MNVFRQLGAYRMDSPRLSIETMSIDRTDHLSQGDFTGLIRRFSQVAKFMTIPACAFDTHIKCVRYAKAHRHDRRKNLHVPDELLQQAQCMAESYGCTADEAATDALNAILHANGCRRSVGILERIDTGLD
jgi:hypothetical protein